MNTIGVLLLAAATATSGIGKPFTRKFWLHPHAVQPGPIPPGGPVGMAGAGMGGAGMGCMFGHPGCAGGPSCPGAGGAMGPGAAGRRFPNVRSQVYFVDPPGMKIGWQAAAGGAERVYLPGQLTVPARYNFLQGYIYRLKLTDIPGRPGLQLYPTVEVAPSTPATDAYLTHNPIPAQFTEEDFDQVTAGNFVTKVVYLPDPRFQELAVAGVETLVSTRLEPGVDPILEADRRGTILMIIRLGAIDLEMPNAGGATVVRPTGPGLVPQPGAMAPGMAPPPGTVLPPGSLPPGVVPGAPAMPEGVPVETAPVTPAPTGTGPFTPPAPGAAAEPQPQPPTPSPSAPETQPAPPATEQPAPPATEQPAPPPAETTAPAPSQPQ